MPSLKEKIGDIDVEIDIETCEVKFRFHDEEEGVDEVLIMKDSAILLQFLNTFFNCVRPQFVRQKGVVES